MSILLYIPKVLCRVFGCSYTGYSKQEYEFVGCECEHPGGRGAGSRELPPTCTVTAAGTRNHATFTLLVFISNIGLSNRTSDRI